MTLIVGKAPAEVAAPAAIDSKLRIFGYELTDIKEVIDSIIELARISRGFNPAGNTGLLLNDGRQYQPEITPPQPAGAQMLRAAADSKSDKMLGQIAGALDYLIKNNQGELKIFDMLRDSNITVKALRDILSQGLK